MIPPKLRSTRRHGQAAFEGRPAQTSIYRLSESVQKPCAVFKVRPWLSQGALQSVDTRQAERGLDKRLQGEENLGTVAGKEQPLGNEIKQVRIAYRGPAYPAAGWNARNLGNCCRNCSRKCRRKRLAKRFSSGNTLNTVFFQTSVFKISNSFPTERFCRGGHANGLFVFTVARWL